MVRILGSSRLCTKSYAVLRCQVGLPAPQGSSKPLAASVLTLKCTVHSSCTRDTQSSSQPARSPWGGGHSCHLQLLASIFLQKDRWELLLSSHGDQLLSAHTLSPGTPCSAPTELSGNSLCPRMASPLPRPRRWALGLCRRHLPVLGMTLPDVG